MWPITISTGYANSDCIVHSKHGYLQWLLKQWLLPLSDPAVNSFAVWPCSDYLHCLALQWLVTLPDLAVTIYTVIARILKQWLFTLATQAMTIYTGYSSNDYLHWLLKQWPFTLATQSMIIYTGYSSNDYLHWPLEQWLFTQATQAMTIYTGYSSNDYLHRLLKQNIPMARTRLYCCLQRCNSPPKIAFRGGRARHLPPILHHLCICEATECK